MRVYLQAACHFSELLIITEIILYDIILFLV